MSFSKIRNNVLWCILLLWTFSMAGNIVSSDLKGDEEATQDEQTSKTFRDGNIVQPGDVQLNTDGSDTGNFLRPVDVQSTDRTGNIVPANNNVIIKSTDKTFRAVSYTHLTLPTTPYV